MCLRNVEQINDTFSKVGVSSFIFVRFCFTKFEYLSVRILA